MSDPTQHCPGCAGPASSPAHLLRIWLATCGEQHTLSPRPARPAKRAVAPNLRFPFARDPFVRPTDAPQAGRCAGASVPCQGRSPRTPWATQRPMSVRGPAPAEHRPAIPTRVYEAGAGSRHDPAPARRPHTRPATVPLWVAGRAERLTGRPSGVKASAHRRPSGCWSRRLRPVRGRVTADRAHAAYSSCVKTVESHLGHIFTKLGTRFRQSSASAAVPRPAARDRRGRSGPGRSCSQVGLRS